MSFGRTKVKSSCVEPYTRVEMQAKWQFVKGWEALFDVMHQMLEDNIAPTATALEQEFPHEEHVDTDENQLSADIHHFLTHDGRSV